jgi:hypothetical protein
MIIRQPEVRVDLDVVEGESAAEYDLETCL